MSRSQRVLTMAIVLLAASAANAIFDIAHPPPPVGHVYYTSNIVADGDTDMGVDVHVYIR